LNRCVIVACVLALPARAVAQHEHHEAPRTRAGWQIMLHAKVFGQFIRESGPRGNWQLGSVNWLMARADHALAGGTLGLRTMVSAEFLTLTRAGYPELLQVAEPYRGGTLTDRMHPHELFGEAAITYERDVVGAIGASLYLAAAGEPALGPVAYLHRPSAEHDPIAPLTHHGQDDTHESFGVTTIGLFTRHARFEVSAFNGNHPDDVRTNFELAGARLNSFSARVTVNPAPEWSLSASTGYIAASSSSTVHAHGALHRHVLAIMHVRPRPEGVWASSFIWAANAPIGSGRVMHSILLETNLDVNSRNTLFGRLEYAARTAEDLNLVGSVSEQLAVGQTALGYARRLANWEGRGFSAWLGGRATAYFVPEELRLFYGSRVLRGFAAYVQLRPPVMHDRTMEPL
jgi:hypothetical protein